MKKRIHITRSKRSRLLQDAMMAAREARSAIDPVLLERARQAIGGAALDYQRRGSYAHPLQEDSEMLDRRKTLSIVKKYLEMKTDNPALLRQVRALLAEQ